MQAQPDQKYTYKDYLTWPEEEHWELIDGVPYPTYGPTALAAPNLNHQRLVRRLVAFLEIYLMGKTCEVFDSPVDVVFEKSVHTKTVVQPDLVVVCDPKKMKNGKRIIGAPDIAIEVLSPSTSSKDWLTKSRLYEKHGVKEYWIVSPRDKILHQNILKDGEYETIDFTEGQLATEILEGFSLDIKALFDVMDGN